MTRLGSGRRGVPIVLGCGLLAVGGGCDASDTPPEALSLFGGERPPQELVLDEVPVLRVGYDEADPIHNVRDAKWLGDRLVFTNGVSLVFVDREGRRIRQSGRRGEGPGEFRNITGFDRFDDGFIVWDGMLLRLSVLDSLGHYVRSTRLLRGDRLTRLVGAIGSNALFRASESGFPGDGQARPQEVQHDVDFLLVRIEDAEILGAWSVPGSPRWARREIDATGMMHGGLKIPFGRDPVVAIIGAVGYIGTTDAVDFMLISRDGVSGRFALRHDPVPVEPEWERVLRDSIRDEIDAIRPGRTVLSSGENFRMSQKRFRASLLEGLPARETLPAFSALEGDREGRLWLREYPIPGVSKDAVWTIIDPTSGPVAWIRLAPDLEILDIAHEHIVVLAEGALGQEIIEVYAIRPRGGDSPPFVN